MKNMKVTYFPSQPHCFAFGGFDLQMLNTLEAIKKQGVEGMMFDLWSRDKDFDIIHLWGVDEHNYQVIDWCKKSGILIVATVLLPYYDTLRSKIGHVYRFFFSQKFKRQVKYYQAIDRIIVVNDIQAKILHQYYMVPFSKIDIIPHLVEQAYFKSSTLDFSKKYQTDNYILCTGNICNRKNQYNLALACLHLNYRLVLIGKVMDGEAEYANKLEKLVHENKGILWIKELPKASDDLVAAYSCCKLFALPSLVETQPISALEAVAMGKPLVLLNKTYAHQNYYEGAFLCSSPSVKDIEICLRKGMGIESPNTNTYIADCQENEIGRLYKQCYEKLFY